MLAADVDACAAAPCSASGRGNVSCVDLPPPAAAGPTGRKCVCDSSAGLDYAGDELGCAEYDACLESNFPCKGDEALNVCTDIPGGPLSAAGRNCSCTDPSKTYTEAGGCVDVDACKSHPCTQSTVAVSCTDRIGFPDSPAGRTCSCPPGFEYREDSGCIGEQAAPGQLCACACRACCAYVRAACLMTCPACFRLRQSCERASTGHAALLATRRWPASTVSAVPPTAPPAALASVRLTSRTARCLDAQVQDAAACVDASLCALAPC